MSGSGSQAPDAAARRADAVARTFFAQLAACGVRHVVVSPGSRSTPLTVAAHRVGLRCWVQLDERSAGFHALGLARGGAAPVVLVCTSGTAAANHLPAVVEANHAGVPLIVCTADRPPELRSWGAGQTIDQVHLHGTNVRWFADLPVASEVEARFGSRVALRAVAAATGWPAGPVHLNWPFREPLEPPAVPTLAPVEVVPAPRLGGPAVDPAAVDLLVELASRPRGLLVAGPLDLGPAGVRAAAAIARHAGWPILADPLSSLRWGDHVAEAPVVGLVDHVLAAPDLDEVPEIVVRLGLSPTSKPWRSWIEAHRPERLVVVSHTPEVAEPTASATDLLSADPEQFLVAVAARLAAQPDTARSGAPRPAAEEAWARRWLDADRAAEAALHDALGPEPPWLGPAVARTLVAAVPPDAIVFASNSLPVRLLDAFVPARADPLVVRGHRGANGIDGIVSGAAGLAAGSGRPVVALLGDLALLHDLGGVLAAARDRTNLVLVVIDNDGGGIFSFLPIAQQPDVGFEALFTTPHGHDLCVLAAAAGIAVADAGGPDELATYVHAALARGGPSLVRVRMDTAEDVAHQRAVRSTVMGALGAS